ncbi:dystrophin isoform X2 [Echeneis naucrates]|uniref:dystrophin isoform X2 n=1 Tax=Echeneis naucrates TaxID=173247 RepID=UPI0011145AC3|nr:dystrophin-like isoform X2 [Echeneis naucrates]
MRMQDRVNWDSQKQFGETSDQHLQQRRDGRRAIQKRTFTRWMNVFLQRCDPPVEVRDLFVDIQDGRMLMALLEELSGCKLLYRFRSSAHRIFRLNNISKALAFLDDRHVKLLGIDASGIADGVPSVVLSLIWNIILHFQVKEVTRCSERHLSSSLSALSMSSYTSSSDFSPQPDDTGSYSCSTLPSKSRKVAREPKYHGKAIKTFLQWVQRCTSKFGVEVHDFGKSWRNGMAFLALIKYINPDLVDLRESLSREPRENIQQAFMIANRSLDIIPLLEPEDVTRCSPDEQSIITYVSMFLRHCSDVDEDRTTDIEVPQIPNFGTPESVSFGEILADNTEAQALFRGLEKSNEQLLWKRWSKRSSGSPRTTTLCSYGEVTSAVSSSDGDIFSPCHGQRLADQSVGCTALSQCNKKKGRCRSILKPPSPLDAGVASQEIQSWLEKGSDQANSKTRGDEGHLSLSSEEGIYTLSVLDSDEEDAYSYILDLNKEVFQPSRQVTSVKEETAEEMNEESNYLETCEILNGCKLQEGFPLQNADFDLESEVGTQSVVCRKFDLEKNESSFRDMKHNRPVFPVKPKDESSRIEEEEEERVGGQINNYDEEMRETENVVVKCGYDKTKSLIEESEQAKIIEMYRWQNKVEGGTERRLSEKSAQVSEKRPTGQEEENNLTTFEEVQERKFGKEKHEGGDTKREEGLGVGELRSARVHTNEKRKNTVSEMEDLTKNWKYEDTEECADEVTNPEDFAADRGVEIKKRRLTAKKGTIQHLGETTTKSDTNGGVSVGAGSNSHTSCGATPHSYREGGFILQSLAASCDITPLELGTLLCLWILLYCCLILPQMNL